MRSVGTWNVPTFSAREWRSAALDVDGANGSWTWQTSSGTASCIASIVRATSTGSDGARRVAVISGSTSPTESTRGGAPGSGSRPSGSVRSAARDSRTASWLRAGATMSTRCPRAARASAEPRTWRLTSRSASSQGRGVTCAIASGPGTGPEDTSQTGTASSTLTGEAVGMTRSRRNPARARRSAYSSSVRSRAARDEQHHHVEHPGRVRLVTGRQHHLDEEQPPGASDRGPDVAEQLEALGVLPVVHDVGQEVGVGSGRAPPRRSRRRWPRSGRRDRRASGRAAPRSEPCRRGSRRDADGVRSTTLSNVPFPPPMSARQRRSPKSYASATASGSPALISDMPRSNSAPSSGCAWRYSNTETP